MDDGLNPNHTPTWSTAQRRCFQRIKSGLTWHNNEILRFLTLGSAPEMKRPQQESFRALKERMKRTSIAKLYKNGYITKNQLTTHYSGKPFGYTPQFNYIKIKTEEGPQGVLHILYFGDFIPQSWLKEVWVDLTGGCRSAFIRMCKYRTYNEKRLARYCIDQYCAGQTEYLRYSCSKDWVYLGFVKHYNILRSDCKDYSHAIGECYGNPVYRLNKELLKEKWNTWLTYHGSCPFEKYRGSPPLEIELSIYDDSYAVFNQNNCVSQ
jgi:hypothetical protein